MRLREREELYGYCAVESMRSREDDIVGSASLMACIRPALFTRMAQLKSSSLWEHRALSSSKAPLGPKQSTYNVKDPTPLPLVTLHIHLGFPLRDAITVTKTG